jgi:hypothetical protein
MYDATVRTLTFTGLLAGTSYDVWVTPVTAACDAPGHHQDGLDP